MIPFSRWRKRNGDYPKRVSSEQNGTTGNPLRDTTTPLGMRAAAGRDQLPSPLPGAGLAGADGVVNMNHSADETRGFLWVDAVGGFLVCLKDAVVLGQAVPGAGVDIPILGDLSTRHARICRSGEGYVVEPIGPVTLLSPPVLNPSISMGQSVGTPTALGTATAISKATVLTPGDVIQLGDKVRIRFRKPHPLSNTACLDMLSGHRTSPSADGILLLGTTCLLGSLEQNHIVCRDWTNEIVLFRGTGGKFRFRSGCRVELNGIPAADAGELPWNTRLSGEDFALTMDRG